MNIFLIKWDYNDSNNLIVAQGLEKAGHKIVYWVGTSRNNASDLCRKNFPQTIFHNIFDAISGQPPKEFLAECFSPPSEELIKNLYEAESILSTMKQFEKIKMAALEKKVFYHNHLEYWLGVINKLKLGVVIFSLYPHTGFDFILFSLAKLLKIKTIMFDGTGISDRHMLFNDYLVGSHELRKEIEANKNKIFTIENLSPDIKEYYLDQINKTKDSIYRDYKILKKPYSGLNLLLYKLKIVAKSLMDLSIFKKLFFYIIKKSGKNFIKEYVGLQGQADFSKKFIYVALHFQPECATSPLGGVFVDQLLMIKILSYAVPDDWLIYVKEHPYHRLSQGINYTNFRYPGYYKAIAKINKVRLVPMEVPAVDLINKSQAVVTITGTVGREAVMRLKPVLIFGYPSYRDCPGVYKVNSVESCRAALAKINFGLKITEPEIINYLISLDRVSFHTYFEKTTEKVSKLSSDERAEILVKVLKQEIEK